MTSMLGTTSPMLAGWDKVSAEAARGSRNGPEQVCKSTAHGVSWVGAGGRRCWLAQRVGWPQHSALEGTHHIRRGNGLHGVWSGCPVASRGVHAHEEVEGNGGPGVGGRRPMVLAQTGNLGLQVLHVDGHLHEGLIGIIAHHGEQGSVVSLCLVFGHLQLVLATYHLHGLLEAALMHTPHVLDLALMLQPHLLDLRLGGVQVVLELPILLGKPCGLCAQLLLGLVAALDDGLLPLLQRSLLSAGLRVQVSDKLLVFGEVRQGQILFILPLAPVVDTLHGGGEDHPARMTGNQVTLQVLPGLGRLGVVAELVVLLLLPHLQLVGLALVVA
mmetsp:Transcript_31591/g.56707  ORF Transcript_31591/g.56707 Transcript_31591/m.56707 type:complete len:329 (+) Transcript_31591:735-1721(+)